MATVKTLAVALVGSLGSLVSVPGCDELRGFDGEVTPLATVSFVVTGDLEAVRVPEATDPALHVALVWGAQWLPDPLCFFPPESVEVEAVLAAGCRDSFGFVPLRAAENVAIELGVPGSISLYELPSAEVLIGNVTSRIAYASLVVFDDRNATGRLELGAARDELDDDFVDPLTKDIVYGSSFVSMTEPDVRLVLREGGYNDGAAFYPRVGCGIPVPGFSIAAAGGFTREAALAAVLLGQLPAQDPSSCRETAIDDTVIEIPLRPVPEVGQIGCRGRQPSSAVEYLEPPVEPLDLTDRATACASIPDFGTGKTAGITQFVMSSRSDERCRNVIHLVLKGCEEDATCAIPEFDLTANPPAWWPCPP